MKCKKCGYEHEEGESKEEADEVIESKANDTSKQDNKVEEKLFQDDEPKEGDNLGKAKKATLAAIIKKKLNVK